MVEIEESQVEEKKTDESPGIIGPTWMENIIHLACHGFPVYRDISSKLSHVDPNALVYHT